jgi:hypothetical protein
LLARRTRTRQGENFLFRHPAFAWQAIESRQGSIHFVFRRKKILIDALNLLVGQPLDFFDDLSCVHGEPPLPSPLIGKCVEERGME